MNEQSVYQDTDKFYQDLWLTMANDFRDNLDDPAFMKRQELALLEGGTHSATAFRDVKFPDIMQATPAVFKRVYQLSSLLKRYRFRDDKYKQDELKTKTMTKFFDTQHRIDRPISSLTHSILQRARKHVKRILGHYDPQEHVHEARFGRRASVGNKASQAYLDVKLNSPVSGSRPHIQWFNKAVLPGDKLLASLVRETHPCASLAMTLVPKSYKSLRCIMPNSLIGTYYTYGLGQCIRKRLEGEGLDISRLQERHKFLARLHSCKDPRLNPIPHVTADLSSASDSFTFALVAKLVPREWLTKLNYGRLRSFTMDGKFYYMNSFMAMGIGFTFPLQTLLFYAILLALGDAIGAHGKISVYGDDLIYPRSMHFYVRRFFETINFTLNDDKTFVQSDFRESCGGDYYDGVDVRPFQPEGQYVKVSRTLFRALLHKTYNGLISRWDPDEIPGTLAFIKGLLLEYPEGCLFVPPLFPDYSGLRVPVPPRGYWDTELRSFRFISLIAFNRDRLVPCQKAYYWDKLRSSSFKELPSIYEEDVPTLRWRRVRPQPKRWKRPYPKLEPVVDLKGSTRYKVSNGSVPEWQTAVGSLI